MKIKTLQKMCHKIAVEKGFWGDCCSLCKGTGKEEIEAWESNLPLRKYIKIQNPKRPKCSKYKIKCECCNGLGRMYESRNNGELIALMHSELSETLAELRERKTNWDKVGTELADCVIRIMDFCEARGINLEKKINKKIIKNKSRAYKHGKKF